jgi:hypothetical protein
MGTTWITGVCVRQNRLEWTVLRRTKESWDVHGHGEADLSAPWRARRRVLARC